MPNPRRYTFQFFNSFIPEFTAIFAEVAIGADGAPTLSALHSIGVASISRVDVGQYLITLNNKYNRLVDAGASFVAPGGAAAPDVSVEDDAVLSAGTLTINCQAGGVNTDPADGETMLVHVYLKNSTVAAG